MFKMSGAQLQSNVWWMQLRFVYDLNFYSATRSWR